MYVVILAAGKGSRLGFPGLPKPLTPLVNGKTILSNQLTSLEAVVSLDRVIVVVGYQQEKIIMACPDLLYVYNPCYSMENTAKSLLRALRKVDDDVLWINGDVVFHPHVLQQIIRGEGNRMVVNKGAVGDEEVKYRTDGHENILEVSKNVQKPEGESLGINLVIKKDLPVLCQALKECEASDYFEKGIERCIQRGVIFHIVPIDAHLCTEVDFPEDLQHANALIADWDRG